MLEYGWIKIHRKLVDWEWYDDDKAFRLFLHLLLTCNYEEKKWRGKVINPGERVTSYPKLSEELGWSVQQIRTALNKLKSTGELTVKTSNKYSLIEIKNWERYQDINSQVNSQATVKQQSNNTNVRKIRNKEEYKTFKKPTIEEVSAYVAKKGYGVDPEKFWDSNEARGWMLGKQKMKDWRAAVRTWERNRKKWGQQNSAPKRHKYQDFFDLLAAYVPRGTMNQMEKVEGEWQYRKEAFFEDINIVDLYLNFEQAIKDNDDWPITKKCIEHMNNPRLIEFLKTNVWKK